MGMGIEWKQGDEKLAAMETLFLSLGKNAISMNHYDLELATRNQGFAAKDWKEFLTDIRVKAFIDKEFLTIRDAEFRKIISNINSSRSVGQAQIINSLGKMLDATGNEAKKGPAFIYMYVPLTDEELQAENVEVLSNDPFQTT